ncbi:hypothetical protein [Leptospira noguchii]|uniref:hypothetical protein n=1 Tax=Leptospira noguchii TaxID=28182 RepID=UPI001F065636|nr:hypothetical protein [Leptospira noguchii]
MVYQDSFGVCKLGFSILPRFYDWSSSITSIVSLITVTLSNFYLLPERFIFTLNTNFVSEFWPRGTIF